MVPEWKLENILPELTTHAVEWIEESAESKKPFFLYFALTSPHYPVVPSSDFLLAKHRLELMVTLFIKRTGVSAKCSMRSKRPGSQTIRLSFLLAIMELR